MHPWRVWLAAAPTADTPRPLQPGGKEGRSAPPAAHSNPSSSPAAAAMPAVDIIAQRGDTPPQGQPPSGPIIIQRVVYRTLEEPYQGWQEPLIKAFRLLRPETSAALRLEGSCRHHEVQQQPVLHGGGQI